MTALTFDTLSASKTLTESGIPEKHAEAMTRMVKEAQDAHVETLATKADITELKGEMKLIKWMLGVLMAGVAALVLKTFFGA